MKIIFDKYLGLSLFLFALVAGIFTSGNYGLAWDEPAQREIGKVNYDYAVHGDRHIENFPDNDHGAGFEIVLIVIEKSLGLTDSRDIFMMRHILTHILFLIAALAFFFLIDLLYHNKWLATTGFLLLILNPQICPFLFQYQRPSFPFDGGDFLLPHGAFLSNP